jgi:hypothetical protein
MRLAVAGVRPRSDDPRVVGIVAVIAVLVFVLAVILGVFVQERPVRAGAPLRPPD